MSKRVGYIISLILSVIIAGLFFFNWMGLSVTDILGSDGTSWVTACFQGIDLANSFGSLGGSELVTGIMALSIGILVVIALSIICFAVYIIKGAVSGRGHKKWGINGTVLAMLLAAATIIIPEILKNSDSMIGIILGSTLKATLITYAILVIGILNLIFMTALDKGKQVMDYNPYGDDPYGDGVYNDNNYNNYNNYDNSYDNNYDGNYDNTAVGGAATKECPACGGINPDIAAFCKKCGYHFNAPITNDMDYVDERPPIDPASIPYMQPVDPTPYTPHTEPEPVPYTPPVKSASSEKSAWSRAGDMQDLSGGTNSGDDDNNSASSLKINM